MTPESYSEKPTGTSTSNIKLHLQYLFMGLGTHYR